MTTALLISTYNWSQALELVLLSVLNQTVMPNEILIADDGSKEETKRLIDSYRLRFNIPLKHIWHEDKGFRKTIILNKAVKETNADYIIQIDGDIILHPMFIADHSANAQPGVFIKGSRAMLTKAKTEKQLKAKDVTIHALESGVKSSINAFRIYLIRSFFYGDPKTTHNTKGCNFAFWKNDFIAVNGYNNDLLGWGHEDIEIAARLVNKGVKRRHLKMAAVCFHLHHNSSNEKQSSEKEENLKIYENTILQKIDSCKNGYQQSFND